MNKLPPFEYCMGYTRALLDVEKALQSIESDLLLHNRRITIRILHDSLHEIQRNSANLRESIGFLRYNFRTERPEWYVPHGNEKGDDCVESELHQEQV